MKRALSIIIFLFILSGCSKEEDRIRILMDTDANNELDDQHAIAYMLFNGDVFDVEGITVNKTRNGGDIEKHFEEAERVVKLCNVYPEVKIYKGATGKFADIKANINEPHFDGSDAVDFIIKRAKVKSDRELILMPVGKLTNIALALLKDPSIIPNIKIVWLGSNYPEPGEYNQVNDISALQYILDVNVDFEIATVRYGKPSGTAAVVANLTEIEGKMPGLGPNISDKVIGRHGKSFSKFGDYSVNLFQNAKMYGEKKWRSLFDMAAVAIVKNPTWATAKVIAAPQYVDGVWVERNENKHKIKIWENFEKEKIMKDFYDSIRNYKLSISH